ncbi:alpha-tectorin-like [Dicentrarchus labrax]|uniref:alpha-tectorin-like n=1 Tax=Dicentrarchus labrax TaxID=13489 RepID=UPI0021F64E7B|nr:alpha-tectorin-like [Dicentrarchus labrax]
MLRLVVYLTAVLHFSTCGSEELCQGDQCVLCTVTGPTVIDVHSSVSYIEDRCGYTLMNTSSIPDLLVHATFKERRRQDVSFLDRVILSLVKPGVHIYLDQGGRVQLDNVTMTLNTTAQVVHGVELSKNKTGVSAKMSNSNYTVTVFFDGYTAQIHIKGPSGQVPFVEGLCGNSSISEARSSNYSASGCETQYVDTSNSTIDCNKTTEHCNLLKEAPFNTSHSNIKPDPFITACNYTLCKYPAVDGLKCQFLEAYARASSLFINDTLAGWRTNANCSEEPQAFCQDQFCSAHEFCGDNSAGNGTRCHCRAIFASPYRSQNSLGDLLVCNGTSSHTTLVGCLLEDRNIHYTELHLYDSSCRAEQDNVTHAVTIAFDSESNPCGTMIKMSNDSQYINKNGIMVSSNSEELLDFSCPFSIPAISFNFSMEIKIKDNTNSSTVAYATFGYWNTTVTMKAYSDPGRTQAVDANSTLHLNQKIWFELKADTLDDQVALVTHSCYATSEPSANSSLRYNLIIDGCANPADNSVTVEGNGESASNYFSFKMFHFSGKSGDVFLHCSMSLCVKANETCNPSCGQSNRRRRSVTYEEEKPTFIIMAWGR